jgi:HipA-like protein
MRLALEEVRRMRGGAQAHLMRCEDDGYYVVKFQNNPQGVKILANELLGTRLAARLGLPTAPAGVVQVGEELIAHTEDLVMQLGRGRAPCRAGRQFGSRYPQSPAEAAVYDFLPDEQLRTVSNLSDFCGMLVFDKWTCNTNGRQAVFFRRASETHYEALMIDQGFCFNAGEWNFPDAPLRGLYARHRVYESVRGIEAFEPWLERLETKITEGVLEQCASEIPPEWFEFETEKLEQLLERLLRRRKLVRELIFAAWKSTAQPFPNWK